MVFYGGGQPMSSSGLKDDDDDCVRSEEHRVLGFFENFVSSKYKKLLKSVAVKVQDDVCLTSK